MAPLLIDLAQFLHNIDRERCVVQPWQRLHRVSRLILPKDGGTFAKILETYKFTKLPLLWQGHFFGSIYRIRSIWRKR